LANDVARKVFCKVVEGPAELRDEPVMAIVYNTLYVPLSVLSIVWLEEELKELQE